jgi:hypothetical protein
MILAATFSFSTVSFNSTRNKLDRGLCTFRRLPLARQARHRHPSVFQAPR